MTFKSNKEDVPGPGHYNKEVIKKIKVEKKKDFFKLNREKNIIFRSISPKNRYYQAIATTSDKLNLGPG